VKALLFSHLPKITDLHEEGAVGLRQGIILATLSVVGVVGGTRTGFAENSCFHQLILQNI